MNPASSAPIYNRILLKRPGFYRSFVDAHGQPSWVYDDSSLRYLVSEFIAASAVEVAFASTSPAGHSVGILSPVLRERTKLIDTNQNVRLETEAFFQPLAKEFGLTFQSSDGALVGRSDLPPSLIEALKVALPGVYDFLLGAHYRLQIGLDLDALRGAVQAIREVSQDQDVDALFSALIGVLNSYKPVGVPSLALVTVATEDHEARFRDLVEDLAYRNLSEDAALLGIPADLKRAITLMKRAVRAVLAKPALGEGIKFATKRLMTAHGLDGSAIDFAKVVAPKGYFPPILMLDEAYRLAEQRWRDKRIPAADDTRFEGLFEKGLVEVLGAGQPTFTEFQGKPVGEVLFMPPGHDRR